MQFTTAYGFALSSRAGGVPDEVEVEVGGQDGPVDDDGCLSPWGNRES